jgi:predicted acetyltransferase
LLLLARLRHGVVLVKNELIPAKPADRAVLRQLYELYCYDFSEITGDPIDSNGRFTPDHLLVDWWDGSFYPFLFKTDGNLSGLAFVGIGSYVRPRVFRHHLMEEFFVLRAYRRRGVGAWFARQLFEHFQGVWEIGQITANVSATAFWRRTLERNGLDYDEVDVENDQFHGRVQILTYRR